MTAFAALGLFVLNLSICWRLFKIELTTNFSSIEGAFIAIARYISGHWGHFSWWPMWHCGMPYQDTYVPLLHLVVGTVAYAGHLSAARAYHSVTGISYALGPVTLYLLAMRLGSSRSMALLAALFYSLFSPSAVLLPDMARDIGGWWYARRLQVLTVYGEGPHVTAMTLLPVALLCLENVLVRRTTRSLAFAAIAIASIFLTNVPGSMALGLAVFCWICSQPAGTRAAAWAVSSGCSALAYGIACYGVPPSSVRTIVENVGPMHSGFRNSLKYGPLPLLAVLAAIWAVGYLLARTRFPLIVRFAILYFALTTTLVVTANSDVFELLPQAGRLHLELEMAASLLLGGAAAAIYRAVPRWWRPAAVAVLVPLIFVQWHHYRSAARKRLQPVDLSHRSEYTSARWLATNIQGQRVYAMGSTSFWLNAFTDTPQVAGCCDQNLSMPVLPDISYLINSGTSVGETVQGIEYMRALGAAVIVVNGPGSTDEYKDIKAPERFKGVLPLLYQGNGDTIYGVYSGRYSLAHVLHPDALVPTGPSNQLPSVTAYVRAIGDPASFARFEWVENNIARIRATISAGDVISVQVPWFSGWKAYANGREAPIGTDGLHFMVIHPACAGDCQVELAWTGPRDWLFAAIVSALSLALLGTLLCGWTPTRRAQPGVS